MSFEQDRMRQIAADSSIRRMIAVLQERYPSFSPDQVELGICAIAYIECKAEERGVMRAEYDRRRLGR